MVVIFWPATAEIGRTQASRAHAAKMHGAGAALGDPQPNLVPFQVVDVAEHPEQGHSGGASTVVGLPLIVNEMGIGGLGECGAARRCGTVAPLCVVSHGRKMCELRAGSQQKVTFSA